MSYSRLVAIAFLVLLFSVNVHRARTQALTTDEAYVYRSLGTRARDLFNPLEANYHPLHTQLVYASTHLFGLSELTLRLPSLVGCALYFTAVYRIGSMLFGATPLLLLAIALLTANPLLQDHMSIGRPYGLALALFAWALSEAMNYSRSAQPDRILFRAGVLLGLTLACTLTFIYPVLALAAVLAAFVLCSRKALSFSQRLWKVVDHLAGPGLVTAFLFVALSLQGLGHPVGDFRGKASLVEMADGVFTSSFFYRDCFLNESAGCYHPWLKRVGYWAALLIFFACLASAALMFWRKMRSRMDSMDAGLVFSGTLATAALLTIASSAALGTPYHGLRRALFFVVLAELCLLAVCRWLWSRQGWARAGAWLWSGGLAVLALAMFLQFDTRYYIEWRFDAGNKAIMNHVRAIHGESQTPARLVASFPLHWALEVYRQMDALRWLAPVEPVKIEKGFDYYVLRMDDSHYVQDLGLRKILVDHVSGTLLAIP